MNNTTELVYNTFLSSYDTVALLDTLNKQIIFIKNIFQDIPVNQSLSIQDFSESFLTKEYIHSDDLYMFHEYLSEQKREEYINNRYDGILFAYRCKLEQFYHWYSISLFTTGNITDNQFIICRNKMNQQNSDSVKVICMTVPFSTKNKLVVKTFGNFDVFKSDGTRISFSHKQSKELLAYLIDKQGYPVSTKDIVIDVLEKEPTDKTAIKYVSALTGYAITSLSQAGFEDIIIKEWNSFRIDTNKIDCDYYHLMTGDTSYFNQYHNEYMKEYSWAEETNAEILLNSHI